MNDKEKKELLELLRWYKNEVFNQKLNESIRHEARREELAMVNKYA